MNLEGLEMIAVLIVIVLFVKLLEQFGLIEAGVEGKGAISSVTFSLRCAVMLLICYHLTKFAVVLHAFLLCFANARVAEFSLTDAGVLNLSYGTTHIT